MICARRNCSEIEKLGQAAYPNQFRFSHTIAAIRAKWGEAHGRGARGRPRVTVAIAGRIMAIRAQGKAGFATLQQEGQRLQIYVRLDAVGEQGFALYKLLDLGDHIGVTGYLFRTRTGELTIHVETLTFLAKAMLALPEKFHGLVRRRDALPPALRRSVHQPRQPAKSSSSAPRCCGACASSSMTAAISKWKRR